MERGNRTVKQKLLAWQNDHNASPAWSLSLLSISLSINSSVSYSTRKTPFEVVFRHPIISRTWSHPEQSEDEVDESEASDAHLPPDADVARVEWSLDQSDIQQQEEDFGENGASEPTSVQQEAEEGGGSLQADGSVDTGLYSNWEGFGDSVAEIKASLEEDSSSSEASLPDTSSLLGKSANIGRNIFNLSDNKIFFSSNTCLTTTCLISHSLPH